MITLALTLTACVTKTQQVSQPIPSQPPITNEVYLPSPTIPLYQQQAHDVVNAAAPLAGTVYPPAVVFQPVANTLIDSIFGAVAAISTALAAYKTRQAATRKTEAIEQRNAAAALASVVIANPTSAQQAMENAKSNDSTYEVQKHLASAASPT